jgi:hypothetical protein
MHWRFSNRVYGINITATIEKELASTMGSRKSRPMQCNVAFSIGDEGVRKFIQQVMNNVLMFVFASPNQRGPSPLILQINEFPRQCILRQNDVYAIEVTILRS